MRANIEKDEARRSYTALTCIVNVQLGKPVLVLNSRMYNSKTVHLKNS